MGWVNVVAYYTFLDCVYLPPSVMLQRHSAWGTVYDWTVKQHASLMERGLLSVAEGKRLRGRVKKHAAARNISVVF